MKARNKSVDASMLLRGLSAADERDVAKGMVAEPGGIVKGACRSFARAVDWQHSSRAEAGHKLSEDHEGLHSGRFISVSVVRTANALAVKGGYYDTYCQPTTVYRESVPLREVTSDGLGRLLVEMHDRLGGCVPIEPA
jgi:hypothetical protein